MSSIVNRKNGKKSENNGNNEDKEQNIWNNECEELLAEWSEKLLVIVGYTVDVKKVTELGIIVFLSLSSFYPH